MSHEIFSKFLKAVFPACRYDNHIYQKRMSRFCLILLLPMVLIYLFETSYSYRERIEEWTAEPLLYVIFLLINACAILIAYYSDLIPVIVFDSIFFKSGLTVTEITRIFLPSSMIYVYLRFIDKFLPTNIAWIYALIICAWFYINYFLLMRKIMKYSIVRAGIVISFYIAWIIVGALLNNL